ncbi:putative phage integrase [Pseudomonas sp. FH4]|nr:putative phage integrase [Pseudomonas sp. FH4]
MIKQYLLEVEKARPLGKTKKATLEAIGKMDIGKLNDTDVTTQCLVDFALWRMSREGGGVQPQTAGNDLAHLGAVLAIAKDAWGYQVDPLSMGGARRVLRKLGYNLKSRERDRRPTLDELGKVLVYYQAMQARRPTAINMLKVVGFALFSTRRLDEGARYEEPRPEDWQRCLVFPAGRAGTAAGEVHAPLARMVGSSWFKGGRKNMNLNRAPSSTYARWICTRRCTGCLSGSVRCSRRC